MGCHTCGVFIRYNKIKVTGHYQPILQEAGKEIHIKAFVIARNDIVPNVMMDSTSWILISQPDFEGTKAPRPTHKSDRLEREMNLD